MGIVKTVAERESEFLAGKTIKREELKVGMLLWRISLEGTRSTKWPIEIIGIGSRFFYYKCLKTFRERIGILSWVDDSRSGLRLTCCSREELLQFFTQQQEYNSKKLIDLEVEITRKKAVQASMESEFSKYSQEVLNFLKAKDL